MTLDYRQTKDLIDLVMATTPASAQRRLSFALERLGSSHPQFYDGVIKHGPGINVYTSDQWLDFHLKIPHWRLPRDKRLPSTRRIFFNER